MRRATLMFLLGAVGACKDDGPATPDVPANQVVVPAPLLVATFPVPAGNGPVHDTYIRDGIAFVCAWNNGVIILDVGNGVAGGSPSNPKEISRLVTANGGVPGGGAYVHNAWWFHNPVLDQKKYLFIGQEGPASIPTTSNGDIHVVDVSNLAQPVEVAAYRMSGTPPAGVHNFWMDEQAQILYAAYYNGGVVALDVSGTLTGDLASKEIARFKPSTTNFTWGVQLSGNSLYAIDLLNGLFQLRLTGTTFSVVSGGGNVPERYSSDLQVSGNVAYTGTWGGQPRAGVFGNAIKIWTLNATGAPTLADSVIFSGISTVSDVKTTADNKLLVASAEGGPWGGLYIYSLANPQKPVLVARDTMSTGMHTAKTADINGRKYVFATKNQGAGAPPAVRIYDVTAFAP